MSFQREEGMSEYGVFRTKMNEHNFRSPKPAETYLNAVYSDLEDKYNMVTKSITCVYNPNSVIKENAWKNVLNETLKLNQLFLKMPEVIFAMIGIEIHDGKRSMTKKKRKEAEDKEQNKIDKEANTLAIKRFVKEYIREPTTMADSAILVEYKQKIIDEINAGGDPDDIVPEDKKNKDAIEYFVSRYVREPNQGLEDLMLLKELRDELYPPSRSVSLDGYPHIHMGLGITSYNGKMITNGQISKMIMENTGFVDDVLTLSETKKRGCKVQERRQEYILLYALKNCRHIDAYRELGKQKNAVFFNYNGGDDLVEVFETLVQKKGLIFTILDQRNLPETIKGKGPKVKTVKIPTTKRVNNKEEKEMTEAHICYYMEENGYAIRKGTNEVYKKIEGSKRSWKFFDTFDSFIYLTANYTSLRHTILTHKKHHIDTASNPHQVHFPTIDLNFNWIEFNDFYFHIPSAQYFRIELDKLDIPFYVRNVTFDMVREDGNNNPAKPKYWLEIINKQSFSEDPYELRLFFAKFYSILMPLKYKDKVMMLIGAPGTGKTSALDPFRGLFAQEFITQLTGDDKFGCQGLEGARLALADDLSEKTYNSLNIPLICQGGGTMISQQQKHKQGEHKFKAEYNMVIAANDLPQTLKNDKSDRYKVFEQQKQQYSKGFSDDDIFDFANPQLVGDEIDRVCNKVFHMNELTPLARERFLPFLFDKRMNPSQDMKLNDIKREITRNEYALVFLHCAPYYFEVYINKSKSSPKDKMPALPVITAENLDEGLDEIKFTEHVMDINIIENV